MSYYTAQLKAGVRYLAPYGGLFFSVDDCGVARAVDVQLSYEGNDAAVMPGRVQGFQCPAQFDRIYLTAAVDTTVSFFATQAPVNLGIKDGTAVTVPNGVAITNTPANPIPVGITSIRYPHTVTDKNPVTVAATGETPVISNASAVEIRFLSLPSNTGKIYLGSATVTPSNAAIVLNPGDLWVENTGADAPWFAVADNAGSIINLQVISI